MKNKLKGLAKSVLIHLGLQFAAASATDTAAQTKRKILDLICVLGT